MLEFGTFIVAVATAYIAYLQLKKTFPEKPGKRNTNTHRHKGIPSASFLLRSLFTKYPRIVFLLPFPFIAGLKFPDVAIIGSIAMVVFAYISQTRSKRLDVAIGGIFFISSACLGVWLREIELVRKLIKEVPIF